MRKRNKLAVSILILLLLYCDVLGVALVALNRQLESPAIGNVAYAISSVVAGVNPLPYHQELVIESALMSGREKEAVFLFLEYMRQSEPLKIAKNDVFHRCMLLALEQDKESFYELFDLLQTEKAYYIEIIRTSPAGTAYDLNYALECLEKQDCGEGIDLNTKPVVTNQKLRNIIDNLYKGQSNPNLVGNGTTMDAIRSEIATGKPTGGKFHTTKGEESMRGLQNLLATGNLSSDDACIAQALIEDLAKALAGN